MSFVNHRLSFVFLSLTACLASGCGPNSGFRGALQQVGATVVEASSDDSLRSMFESANDACPTRVDAFTTLEEVEMIDPTHAEFRYVVNDAGKKFAARFDRGAMRQAMVEHMRGNAMAVAVADRDLSIQHIYNDEAGSHILSYTINRAVLEGDVNPLGGQQSNPFDVETVMADANEIVTGEAEEHEIEERPMIEEQPPLEQTDEEQPPVEQAIEEKPPLPRQFNGTKRSKNNPAGVQSNPFFNET